jgi:hypothetical protein
MDGNESYFVCVYLHLFAIYLHGTRALVESEIKLRLYNANPPSTMNVWPVEKALSSEAR